MGQGNTKSGLVGWGSNDSSQLASSGHNSKLLAPRLVEQLRSCNVVSVSAQGTYSAIVLDTGDVYTWGTGDSGQLGQGNGVFVSTVPRPVRGQLQGKVVRSISCGLQHCAVVTDSNCLFTWGRGQHGRLGHGTGESEAIPRLVEGLLGTTVLSVSCGDYHTLCLTTSGIYSFGLGLSGRLGSGSEEDQYDPVLIQGPLAGKTIIAIAAGGHHSAALVQPGVVYTWGGGAFGKLGHGDVASCLEPRLVTALSHVRVSSIALGQQHSAAITVSGEVLVWGKAQGANCEDTMVPEQVLEFKGISVAKIVCGKSQTFAITHSGDVWVRGPSSPEISATTAGFDLSASGEGNYSSNAQHIYCLPDKGIVALAVGDMHCLAMAGGVAIESNVTADDNQEKVTIDTPLMMRSPSGSTKYSTIPVSSNQPSLLHIIESVARAAPSPPPNPSMEGEIAFLSSELKTAQSENAKLVGKLKEVLSRVSHLERENATLREELDATMQCLPVAPDESTEVPPIST
jgi:alpha-tubulin suppressor-like RCC1 family protein